MTTRLRVDLELDLAYIWPTKLVQLLQCVPGVTVCTTQEDEGSVHVHAWPRVQRVGELHGQPVYGTPGSVTR